MLPKAIKRIQKELLDFSKAKHTSLFLSTEEKNIGELKGLIIGPEDSPFEHGFFYFHITPPPNYPLDPPKVLFKTPDDMNCRIHPNLYACGKVCLSILGTWGTKDWVPVYTIEKVLITIQGLLDSNPIANEPGYEKSKVETDDNAKKYSIRSRWLTLTTVIRMLKRKDIPREFLEIMREYFQKNFDKYLSSINKLVPYNGGVETFHGSSMINTEQLLSMFREMRKQL